MRTRLRPEDLGDFLDRPECAVLGVHLDDGGILLRPVWYEWRDGAFVFTTDRTDRKLRCLAADARCSITVAEDEWPYRTLEVRGTATWTREGYRDAAKRIFARYYPHGDAERYAAAFDMDDSPGVVVTVAPGVLTVFDYLDEKPAGTGGDTKATSAG
jgi:PPOX class probable F420-dependent enzyme